MLDIKDIKDIKDKTTLPFHENTCHQFNWAQYCAYTPGRLEVILILLIPYAAQGEMFIVVGYLGANADLIQS